MIVSSGFLGTFLLNNLLRDNYNSRKSELEDRVENFLNKKVSLGDYSGIRFLGFSLGNSKITDEKNRDSLIKAKNVYVGIMPLRSFLKQKWVVKITPSKTEINIDRDFFKSDESYKKSRSTKKLKSNYELNLNLNNYSNLRLKNLGLKTKVKGNFIFNSIDRKIIANISSKFDGKGFLKFKFNTKLNNDFLRLELFSRGLDLKNTQYNIGSRKISLKSGKFKSNFKFIKSPKRTFCEGRFSLNQLEINSEALSENINSNSTRFFCKDNNLIGSSGNLNYGTLLSNFNINIPLNETSNKIELQGSIGYINSLNPDIKLSGNIPYWFDKRGINFGNIDSTFDINRTQLSNLNIFRKNNISGFVTANGELKGKINDPNISINFNVDYPNYKGIRIREIWEGNIKNNNNKYQLNMKNRYSPIPSFLSIKFDSNLKLDNVAFSRVFNSNKGSIEIVKENSNYIWRADNFPLDELELSLTNNQFDRIKGIINGQGSISLDQSILDGRLAWSSGKYRNIKLANSLFDFSFKDNSFYVNSSLYPVDGGIIEVEYDSKNNNLINLDFYNISTSWTILTAIDIFNFENKQVIPTKKSNILDDLEINKDDISFKERIDFINNFIAENNALGDKFNLKKYFSKFRSRYNGKINIKGDRPQNYKINAKLNGYLNTSRDDYKKNKDEFSVDLEGGILKGEGSLRIKKMPLSVANIFLNQPKDFQGNMDLDLSYNLDTKSFSSEISSNNTSIKNNKLVFDKGKIQYSSSNFVVDFALLLNESEIPTIINGLIPINKTDKLGLRLIGNGKIIELIDILAEDYFTFEKGDVNLRMIIKGTRNKPILNGFVVIKDSEIDLYKNKIKDINSSIIFDFDNLEIKTLKAKTENSGNIFIKGSLPFYSKNDLGKLGINLITNKFNLKTDNLDFLIDSEIDLNGSFEKPVLGGNLSLNNGFINFNIANQNNKVDNIKQKNDKKDWPELYWNKNKNIEIISNESILNSVLLGETLPNYLDNLSFKNLKLKLGPEFIVQYSNIFKAHLETKLDLEIKGGVGDDLNARGWIYLKKGTANLYTTPFKLDKNKENFILFASRSGVVPLINLSLVSRVPDSIIPINQNNQDTNISGDLGVDNTGGIGSFGIGNTRLIRIEASYEGFLDQLSFEDENKKIQLRSTPNYTRSQIIGLIGGNSANLINRAFISQINNADAFSEKFQFSLYPALIEKNNSLNNIFSDENVDLNNVNESTSNKGISSQEWVAEIGFDITDSINFSVQSIPGRDDLPPTGIITLQVDPNNKIIDKNLDLELLGSSDSNGDWKSQLQLFYRY
ncbi:hypothetical protein CU311_03160 [Prochlorococcus marinus str. MU1402]|nr:hypothetical protein [Prochlorococcus marinus XMU1402]MBW3056404.1 hypothetical protein [Prochlorococcus marinus str. MU1402]